MKHVVGMLKGIMENDMVAPDVWNIHEWDGLADLGFEADGGFKMIFDHEEEIEGQEKKLKITVYKKRDGWYIDTVIDGKPDQSLRFGKYESLLTKIHNIFKKF